MPSLIKYNEMFSKDGSGKRKNKEKQKIIELLTTYRSLTEQERQ